MNRIRWMLLLMVAILTTASSFAQTSKGTLAGVVTDPTGAVIGSATVTAQDNLGAEKRTVTTNSAGEYRIEAITSSTYTLTVTAPGFTTKKIDNVHVEGSVVTSIAAQMEVGTVGQTVEVQASAQTIQTESGDITQTVSAVEIQNLPINSLNPIELAATEPGVVVPGGRESFTNGFGFAVNGLRPRSNNFLLDGFDNNDNSINGQALQPQNPEAIKEVTFLTNAYAPEFGHGGASVTNVIYRSGSNQYHGAFWDRYRGAALDAITSEQHQQGLTQVPNFVENVYGFDGGGPILKNKLFFFGTSQWDHDNFDESGSTLLIPTANGIASLKSLGANANANVLLNSLGNAVAPGGSSSINNINIGNRPGCGSPCLIEVGDYIRFPKAISRSYEYVLRADYTASERDTFSARFIGTNGSLTPDLFANGGALPTQDSFQGGPSRNLGAFWTHVFSPTKVNEVRFTVQQLDFTFGFLGSTLANSQFNVPSISISGLSASFGGPASGLPQGRGHDTFQYQEAFSWNVGHHSFKIGADFVHLAIIDTIPFNSRGTVSVVAGGDCSAIGLTRCTALANYLDDFTGPSGSAGKQFGSPIVSIPQTLQNYYFQDTWKLRPNFTLTYGIRYEYEGTPFNGLPYPAINPNTVLSDIYPLRVTEQPDKNNFGPRFGFAYTPNFFKSMFGDNKTVFRGGFGVFYDGLFTNIEDNTAGTAPNVLGGTLTSPSTGRGSSGLLGLVSGVTPVLNPKATIDVIPSNIVSPLIYQYNFNIERTLPGNLFTTIAYVGTRGERLYLNQELNPGVNGVRLDPARGSITSRSNLGNSSYNGLQINVEHRYTHGLVVRANYTYSKSIDNGSEVFTIQNSSLPQNPLNASLERGLSEFDHRQVATFTWVYDLPFVKRNGVLNYVTKGWNVSGTTQLQSGSPTVVYDQLDTAGTLRANGRPDAGNPNAPINYSDACLNNPTCITGVGQFNKDGSISDYNTGASGTFSQFRYIVPFSGFGNLGRNTVENPGTITVAMAVSRSFAIPKLEGHRIQFRAEAFNPFNHANAGDLSGTINDPNFLNKDVTFTGGREFRFWLYYRF
jgi:outer membrane receptor protein involved in Fe transport